jgi:hypothetical protein
VSPQRAKTIPSPEENRHRATGYPGHPAITAELNVPASVSASSFHGSKGSRLTIRVKLGQIPPGDAQQIKERVTGIVRANFKEQVDVVDVAF